MYKIMNRRYIGGKRKLLDNITKHVGQGETFLELFAGTAIISDSLDGKFKNIHVNDFLFHNFVIYNAFFSTGIFSMKKLNKYKESFNGLEYVENIFSIEYGNKWFTKEEASKIWQFREIIQNDFESNLLTKREYHILNASIILSADKASRSVGHFESFLRSGDFKDIEFKLLDIDDKISKYILHNVDANTLVKEIEVDVVYIDPPYNSRQYAYFYHVLESISLFNLNSDTTFNGVSSKPEYIYEKRSEYSMSRARESFSELIESIQAKKIIVSYNNTFNPSSSSSKNKMSYDEIIDILKLKGNLTIEEIGHKSFNTGKTDFNNHVEYLFIVDVKND